MFCWESLKSRGDGNHEVILANSTLILTHG